MTVTPRALLARGGEPLGSSRPAGPTSALSRTHFLGLAFVLGAVTGLLCLALPDAEGIYRPGLFVVCVQGLLAATWLMARGAKASRRSCEVLAVVAGALIALGIVALGGDNPSTAALQTLFAMGDTGVMIFAFLFLSVRRAVVQVGFSSAFYAAALLICGRGEAAAVIVLLQTGAGLGISLTVARFMRLVRRLSSQDDLTGLANREVVRMRCTRALRMAAQQGKHVGLLLLDLDDFKRINDTLGHAAGDQVLVAVARRLRRTFRAGDVITRWGGDEFVVMVAGVPDPSTLGCWQEAVLGALGEPVVLDDGRVVPISGSVGMAVGPGQGADFTTLLRAADAAMYRHKDARRGVGPTDLTVVVPDQPTVLVA